jgi:hypothetical protein
MEISIEVSSQLLTRLSAKWNLASSRHFGTTCLPAIFVPLVFFRLFRHGLRYAWHELENAIWHKLRSGGNMLSLAAPRHINHQQPPQNHCATMAGGRLLPLHLRSPPPLSTAALSALRRRSPPPLSTAALLLLLIKNISTMS